MSNPDNSGYGQTNQTGQEGQIASNGQQSQAASTDPSQQNYDYYSQYYNYYGGYGSGYDYSQYYGAATADPAAASGIPSTDPSTSAAAAATAAAIPAMMMGMGMGYYGYYSSYNSYNAPKPTGQDPTRSLWVGNLHPETTEAELHATFGAFGGIEQIKHLPAKMCAFVKYVELDSAINSYNAMQRAVIHGQHVKVGWGKEEPNRKDKDDGVSPVKNLWLGNINPETSEEQIRSVFGRYGVIEKIRILPLKGCAFVNFMTLDAAIAAKRELHGTLFGDRPIKINFGREASDSLSLDTPIAPIEPELLIDPPPEQAYPPEDLSYKGVIDKLAEFVSKNGLAFEKTTAEKQKDNPKFGFLFEGHPDYKYYKYKLWICMHPHDDPEIVRAKHLAHQIMEENKKKGYQAVAPPSTIISETTIITDLNNNNLSNNGGYVPSTHTFNFAPPPTYSSNNNNNNGNSYNNAPPPPINEDTSEHNEVVSQLVTLVNNLDNTKDTIKVTKNWIVQNPQAAKPMSELLLKRVEEVRDFTGRLNVLYVIHDVLHHSVKLRDNSDKDPFSEALLPFLGDILRLTYKEADHTNEKDKVKKLLNLWEEKNIFSGSVIKNLENDMRSRSDSSRDRRRDSRDRDSSSSRDRRDRYYDDDRKRGRDSYDRDRYDNKRRH